MSQWTQSHWARTLFRFSSWVVVGVAIFFVFMETPWFSHLATIPVALFILRVIGGTLGVVGSVTSMILWFGMAVYCVRRDRSRFSVKLSWFIFFFIAGPFGSAAYYFSVYRKHVHDELALNA